MKNDFMKQMTNAVESRITAMKTISAVLDALRDAYEQGKEKETFIVYFDWKMGYNLWEEIAVSLPFVAYVDINDDYHEDSSNGRLYEITFMDSEDFLY